MPTPQPIRLFDPTSNQTNGFVVRSSDLYWHGGGRYGPLDWGVITPVYPTAAHAAEAHDDEGTDRPSEAVDLDDAIARHYELTPAQQPTHGTPSSHPKKKRLPHSA